MPKGNLGQQLLFRIRFRGVGRTKFNVEGVVQEVVRMADGPVVDIDPRSIATLNCGEIRAAT